MKYKITFKLEYDKHSSIKVFYVNNCKDKEHCLIKFFKWTDMKFKKANDVVIQEVVLQNSTGDTIFNNLLNIVNNG